MHTEVSLHIQLRLRRCCCWWCRTGWQHLFLAEGLATLVLAGILRWRLPASVLTADFLTGEDKQWLLQQLQPGSCGPLDAVVVQSGADAAAEQQRRQSMDTPGAGDAQDGQDWAVLSGAGSAALLGGSGNSSSRTLSPQQGAYGEEDQQACRVALHQAEQPLQQHQQQHQQHESQQRHSPYMDKQPSLSAKQQLLLTLKNKLIWYLMLLKALKVGQTPNCACFSCS